MRSKLLCLRLELCPRHFNYGRGRVFRGAECFHSPIAELRANSIESKYYHKSELVKSVDNVAINDYDT